MSEPAEQKPRQTPPAGGLRHYFAVTRGPWYGFVFALPVLVAYELLIWVFGGRNVVNGADAVMSSLLEPLTALLGGSREHLLAVLLAAGGLGCWLSHRRRYAGQDGGRLRPGYFLAMLVESSLYALFFGVAVNRIMAAVLPQGLLQIGGGQGGVVFNLTMALGAGIYEELFFRVVVMGGLAVLIIRTGKAAPLAGWLVAALVSSFVFSAFHYVGNLGDTFEIQSFVFRFVAGLLLASLYGLRGFGVAVWTHALYDVLVMVLKA
ncbi:MAG: CPBP family intramembrane metalloprotease [Armatimonadetes bacterium]|nr:CPBP family intramembrane metalloprotease [Armatimonadota bacterium]